MKVESYKIKGWKKRPSGLLISENDDWILVKHINGDYAIDGFKIYNKKFIQKRVSKSDEQQVAKVLQLKKVKTSKPKKFQFDDVISLFKWMEKKYGLFEFQDNEEDAVFFGKIKKVKKDKFQIHSIDADGKIHLNFEYNFSTKKIRSITFKTDYFESIRLLMNDRLKNK